MDPVNKPEHYNQGDIEAIDAIEASMPSFEFQGFCKGNALKYLWRYRSRGSAWDDLRKAQYYLDRLIQSFAVEHKKVLPPRDG